MILEDSENVEKGDSQWERSLKNKYDEWGRASQPNSLNFELSVKYVIEGSADLFMKYMIERRIYSFRLSCTLSNS